MKSNEHDKQFGILFTGKVLKIDDKECYYVVRADYGLDIIKFSELIRVL
jgi:hypothetical protein